MYHYILDKRPDRQGMHPRSPTDFERELDFLTDHYRPGTVPEVFAAARAGGPPTCALTFDDATRDQYDNAAPRLEAQGWPGTFFVISSALAGALPITHSLHILFSHWSGKQVVEHYHRFLDRAGKSIGRKQLTIPTHHHLNPLRLHDDIYTANFKEYFPSLPLVLQKQFLTIVFQELHLDFRLLTAELFMQASELQILARRGHIIGVHTHHHRPFDLLTIPEIGAELKQSQKILAEILGSPPTIISYPYGRLPEKPSPLFKLLVQIGIKHAVVMGDRAVEDTDNPFLIPRFNTNHLRDWLTAGRP